VIPLAFCIPGDINLPTGGYRYDREVLARLPQFGIAASHVPVGSGFPNPDATQIDRALAEMASADRRAFLLIDGLALGALPPDRIAALPHRIVALVHHPLGLEAGLAPDRARFLLQNEALVLGLVRHVIITSPATQRILNQDFGVQAGRMTVAEPGVGRVARAVGTRVPLEVLAVGAISPRKAYSELVLALAENADLDWRLTIAGSLDLSPGAVSELRALVSQCGLQQRVHLAGAVNEAALEGLFHRADLFAMSSQFEGYGMALAEAMARGLPIVTTTDGAANETVPDAAALKVKAGDRPALSAALRRAITDTQLRSRMADASWAAAALLPDWDDTARDIAEAIKSL
jgi:glycosyltransferase involved in cell wall biosynthesis